jgi:hypothetical protein
VTPSLSLVHHLHFREGEIEKRVRKREKNRRNLRKVSLTSNSQTSFFYAENLKILNPDIPNKRR